jgi:hypothetical protein
MDVAVAVLNMIVLSDRGVLSTAIKEANSCNRRNTISAISLGSSTVQLHDSLGIRRACACSEAGFISQNGGCA